MFDLYYKSANFEPDLAYSQQMPADFDWQQIEPAGSQHWNPWSSICRSQRHGLREKKPKEIAESEIVLRPNEPFPVSKQIIQFHPVSSSFINHSPTIHHSQPAFGWRPTWAKHWRRRKCTVWPFSGSLISTMRFIWNLNGILMGFNGTWW